MDAQTLRDCADHIADNISKAIDSIGPIELGPDTQTSIILSGLLASGSGAGRSVEEVVKLAREYQQELRRQR